MKQFVNICGIPHEIVEKDCIESSNGRCVAMITYEDCMIEIRKGMKPDFYRQSLIHEITHGMLVMIGRNDLSDDETFVQTLALAISQTFELNIKTSEENKE